jgi:hypothetical protein
LEQQAALAGSERHIAELAQQLAALNPEVVAAILRAFAACGS